MNIYAVCSREARNAWVSRDAMLYLLKRVDEFADGLIRPITNFVPGERAEVLLGGLWKGSLSASVTQV